MVSVSNQNLALPQIQNNKSKNVSFGFISPDKVATIATKLDILKQNPVLEVAALDVTTMVAPRTAIDYNQNPDYGKETLFRELSPVIFNPYGPTIVAALLMSKYMKYPGVHAGKDTLNTLHEFWKTSNGNNFDPKTASAEHKEQAVEKFVDNLLGSIKSNAKNNESFQSLAGEEFKATREKLAKDVTKLAIQDKKDKNYSKDFKTILEEFTKHTKASECLTVEHAGSKTNFSANIKTILEDVISTTNKVFLTKTSEQLAGTGGKDGEITKLMNFAPKKTLLGAGLSIAAIITLPAINNAITKYRTGKTGYVAYKDDGKDNVVIPPDKSAVFRAKAMGVGIIGSIMLFTMGAFSKDKGFFSKIGRKGFFAEGGGGKNFLDKIELKGKDAGMDLIKLIYGSSLISRVICSRDDQEAKNTTLRDSCGFMNWLVLGGFVTKLVGYFSGKDKHNSLVNITGEIKDTKGSNKLFQIFNTASNWLKNVSLKSISEVKNMNVSPDQMNKNIRNHTIANFAGLAWSMATLGIAMPLINNALTNRAREKQLKQREELLKTKAAAQPLPPKNTNPAKKQEQLEYVGVKPNTDLNQFIRQFE